MVLRLGNICPRHLSRFLVKTYSNWTKHTTVVWEDHETGENESVIILHITEHTAWILKRERLNPHSILDTGRLGDFQQEWRGVKQNVSLHKAVTLRPGPESERSPVWLGTRHWTSQNLDLENKWAGMKLMAVIPALGEQEDCHKLKVSLGYSR